MNPFSILQVREGATQSEINDAYQRLKAEYSERRFLPGREGADACRRLEEIEEAYKDATKRVSDSYNISEGNRYQDVEDAIKTEDIEYAQTLLDNVVARDAEWNYYQAIVFYKKNWHMEAIKQLEMAVAGDPINTKYKDSLNELKNAVLFSGATNSKGSFYGDTSSGGYGQKRSYKEQASSQEQPYCCTPCGMCQGLLCADCCCECMGGDLITCC